MGPAFLAPAKINLTLEVLARRDDGYHGVRSVMVPLDFGDEISVTPSDAFEFTCSRSELEGDANLVVRALRALGDLPRFRVALRKRIPVAAGLGGGSSDAAAVLRAAMGGAFGPPPAVGWLRIARALGSDVPFFLAGTGRPRRGDGGAGHSARGAASLVCRYRQTASGRRDGGGIRSSRPPPAGAPSAQRVRLNRHDFGFATRRLRRRRGLASERLPRTDCVACAPGCRRAGRACIRGSAAPAAGRLRLLRLRARANANAGRKPAGAARPPGKLRSLRYRLRAYSGLAIVTPIPAVVLAGGPVDALAKRQPGAPNKAFVEIGGMTLVARVLTALRAAPAIGRIVAVAPPALRDHPGLALADELRPDGPRITESLRNGLAGFPGDDAVLIVASDLPILTVAAIEDFVARVAVPRCRRHLWMRRKTDPPRPVPAKFRHTWARLRDGTFCGGGIVALKPRTLPLLERFLERLGAARKRPLAPCIAFRLGRAGTLRSSGVLRSRKPRIARKRSLALPSARSFRPLPKPASTSIASPTSHSPRNCVAAARPV